jgi:hypothetical protein
MVMSPAGLGPEKDCAGEDQQQTTDPSSRERGCYIRTPIASVQLKKYRSWVSMGLSPRRNDWRKTASRKVTLTLSLVVL